jgi:phage FluMu protein Com
MMATRIDLQCPRCRRIQEITKKLGETPLVWCPSCKEPMQVYFGSLGAIPINYGFRPERYSNQVDRDIAKFQFTNL